MTNVYEHRAAITRLTALAGDFPHLIWAIEPFVAYHQQAIDELEQAVEAWPDLPDYDRAAVQYPGGPDIRIDPPYDR